MPPLSLALLALLALAAGGRGRGVAIASLLLLLFLATPLAGGLLRAPLEDAGVARPFPPGAPAAIIVLGGDVARTRDGTAVGALTLERLRAGAALHRRTGLPLLVSGGPLSPGDVPLAQLMATTLTEEFGVPVRWIEPQSADTRENAILSVAMLRADGISNAYAVTHAWHLARSREAFARAGFPVHPAPVPLAAPPDARSAQWIPRADHLGTTWYVVREWVGRAVYAIRDGI
ncbi:YdcF family protein [Roseomonas sp. CCTCC AB2023176]|uniref:YdcF family protein n=1 Tax=Roseomonas sp. CCTCC AB2023176 TaxID=3342640 RepID=UPI0035D96BCA